MKREIVCCDYCKKESVGDYFVVYRCSTDGHTKDKADVCSECYFEMKTAITPKIKEARKTEWTNK